MEGDLSAQAIYNFCLKIFDEAGNDKDKWHVETEIK
ncbi:hypothetical protein C7437_10495 [Psychrobacillus insolitus]|uniref:Uncharacterized protein n=1 Tax=Psychrobacillus insolitus TaxID=1461 RepID=A0A2W7MG65_9BACI|nr:hypothetical protein C7437_10495 [Psychrobacillus insolitus]